VVYRGERKECTERKRKGKKELHQIPHRVSRWQKKTDLQCLLTRGSSHLVSCLAVHPICICIARDLPLAHALLASGPGSCSRSCSSYVVLYMYMHPARPVNTARPNNCYTAQDITGLDLRCCTAPHRTAAATVSRVSGLFLAG
jgi:hypothetical protein